MNAEETKVLKQIIGSIKDYVSGSISQDMLTLDMIDYLPEILELENYIEALEDDLQTEREMGWEAERAYDQLWDDYTEMCDDLERYEEDYDEED